MTTEESDEVSLDSLGTTIGGCTKAIVAFGKQLEEKLSELKDNNKKLRVDLATLKAHVVSIHTDRGIPHELIVHALHDLQEAIKQTGSVDCTECPSAGLDAHKRFGDTTTSCAIYAAFKKGMNRATSKDPAAPAYCLECKRITRTDFMANLEGKEVARCARCLVSREKMNLHAIPNSERTPEQLKVLSGLRDRDGLPPLSEDAGLLRKLHWLRDTIGIDIERMFARALKEKDGRGQSSAPPEWDANNDPTGVPAPRKGTKPWTDEEARRYGEIPAHLADPVPFQSAFYEVTHRCTRCGIQKNVNAPGGGPALPACTNVGGHTWERLTAHHPQCEHGACKAECPTLIASRQIACDCKCISCGEGKHSCCDYYACNAPNAQVRQEHQSKIDSALNQLKREYVQRDAVPGLSDVRIEQLAGRGIDPAGTISLDEARAMAVEIQSRRKNVQNKETDEQWFRAEFLYWMTSDKGLGWSPSRDGIMDRVDSLLEIVQRAKRWAKPKTNEAPHHPWCSEHSPANGGKFASCIACRCAELTRGMSAIDLLIDPTPDEQQGSYFENNGEDVDGVVGRVRRFVEGDFGHQPAREELKFIISYLGHQDQDANHAWMVRRIRAVLAGKDPRQVEPWNEADGVRKPGIDWKHRYSEAVKERIEYHRRWIMTEKELEALKRNQSLSWKLVLDCRATYGHITKMAETAVRIGYDYFVWNGHIYGITDLEKVTFEDKGIVEDVIHTLKEKE